MDNLNIRHCQQARRKLRIQKALDYYRQSDKAMMAESERRRIAGTPLHHIPWSAIVSLLPSTIEQVPMGLQGVYLVRYRDNPTKMNPASILCVASALYCIRSRLSADYSGRGNPFLPDFIQANPKDIYFQYVQCDDPKNAAVYLVRALGYPICN